MAKKTAATETATPAAEAPAEKIGKSEAVRRALAAGKDLPADGVAYVKEHFGIEMTNQQFSTNKFQANKKKGMPPGKPGRKPKPSSNGSPATPVVTARFKASANPADLVRGLRQLIAAFGIESVRDTAAALAE